MTTALSRFETALSAATTPDACYEALYNLTQSEIGVTLFTIMETNIEAGEGCRAWSNMPGPYPISGRKALPQNHWFDIVIGKGQIFVANTIDDIDAVFPDAELIAKLGCGSVVNLPVAQDGKPLGSVNMLDPEQGFPPERVRQIAELLQDPATRTMLRAQELQR